MIVINTSALIAIAKQESTAQECKGVIAREERLAISAGTLAEALIVAQGKQLEADVAALIYLIAAEVAPVT